MKRISLVFLLLPAAAIVSPLQAEEAAAPADIQVVFLHNGKEYPPDFLRDLEESEGLPEELALPIGFGDTLGYRRFENGKLAETITGAVAKDGKVVLSNGVEFSTAEMTVFQCLMRIKTIYYTVHSADFGYPAAPPPAPKK
ncbi:MAG: hypothetical protein NTV79_06485 [Candidatus Aureabacteria bacterium]|nr:hypothetical protein [Candidatus Auribacterota bacterium]